MKSAPRQLTGSRGALHVIKGKEMKKLLFIANLRSGRAQIRPLLGDILETFVRVGYEVSVHITQCQGDAEVVARERAATVDRIVCSGGDGTLDEVVSGVMQSGCTVPVGYIPAGSTNDFASSVGISKDMIKAAEAACGGRLFPCDVGRFNDGHFIYVAAFGMFTEVSYQTPQEMKNIFGHAAYVIEGMRQLADIPVFRMEVEWNGQRVYDDFIYGMVTNAKTVGGFSGLIAPPVDLSDGRFEVTLIRLPRTPMDWNEVITYLTGARESTEMIVSFQTSEVSFAARERVPWTLDGEAGGAHAQVEIRSLCQALNLVVP